MKCAVIGLGKLGLPLAALLSSNGHKVIAYDSNLDLVRALRKGDFQTQEPGLFELLKSVKVHYTSNMLDLKSDIEIIFIIVPTPSLTSGAFSNRYILNVLGSLGENFKEWFNDSQKKVVINIVSTVMPGSCNQELIPLLEKSSGMKCGENYTLTYSPEFIALGSVLNDMRYPDMHLIGGVDNWGVDKVLACLGTISKNNPPIARMNFEEAELVKLAINNFVTMKIAFANTLMLLAEKNGNIDVHQVTNAIGLDSRIGQKYLRASTPFGGPCFPRDTKALSYLLKVNDFEESISNTTEILNKKHLTYLLKKIVILVPDTKKRIGICGISYKNGTQVIEESPGLEILKALDKMTYNLSYWDDEGATIPIGILDNVIRANSFDAFIKDVDLIVVTRKISNWRLVKDKLTERSIKFLDLWGNN